MQVHLHQAYSFRILAGVELEQREPVKILSIKALAIYFLFLTACQIVKFYDVSEFLIEFVLHWQEKIKIQHIDHVKCFLLYCFVENFDTQVKRNGMKCVKIESFLCSPVENPEL